MSELCTRDVVCVSADDSIVLAAQLMRRHHVGDVVVVADCDGCKPIGVLTDRDLVVEVLAHAADKASVLRVRDVATIAGMAMAHECDPIEQVLTEMLRRGVRRLPVVDASGSLIGIVAHDDLIAVLTDQLGRLARLPQRQIAQERLRRPGLLRSAPRSTHG